MATHSSILAWRIPWTEEPGGLQPMAEHHQVVNVCGAEAGTSVVNQSIFAGTQRRKLSFILHKALTSLCNLQVLVAHLCPTLCDPMDYSPPGSSVHGDSSGKNTGVGCHALFQGIFLTQGLNPGLPYCRQILYHLSHQGSSRILEWVADPFCRGTS